MAAFFLEFISPLEAAMHCSIWDEFELSVIGYQGRSPWWGQGFC
ncbi:MULTISPECIES: hypothetical protein [unclassified Synechocystis]|nr:MULTISPECIES: hypothetical protein [unclassified Synechocystis]